MSGTRYPFQVAGAVRVVTAPAEIDVTTAGQLRATLFEWHTRGHGTVVLDLTGTQFCDLAALRELLRAHKRAAAGGGELRLVLPADGAVRRAFTFTGLDCLIPHFNGLEQALAQARGDGVVGDCRAGRDREHVGDPAVEASALAWSLTAMSEAAERLPGVPAWDRPRAFAAIGEAVWWITMVDATLARHHPGVYDAVRAAQARAERQLVEQTLAALRFVRNCMGREACLAGVIETGGISAGNRRVTGWTWKGAPEPPFASLPPRKQAWEMARYRAYQAHLAGHTIGETLERAVTFLTLTGADAASLTGA
jgi:anti-sigma B factor antagonist